MGHWRLTYTRGLDRWHLVAARREGRRTVTGQSIPAHVREYGLADEGLPPDFFDGPGNHRRILALRINERTRIVPCEITAPPRSRGAIKTLRDLAVEVVGEPGENDDERRRRIAWRLFKDTACGISFYCPPEATYVSVTGYAEGTDGECPPHNLRFPFSKREFWEAVEDADKEGVELFDGTHEGEE